MSTGKTRKKVAFIYGFPFGTGGVESHLLALISRGNRSEFEWVFVGSGTDSFFREASERNAPVVDWSGPRWQGDLIALVRLRKLLREHRVDLVHAHSPRALLGLALVARSLGVPLVSTVHLPLRYLIQGQGRVARLKLWVYDLIDRVALRRLVNRTLFVSSRVCEDSVSRGLVLPQRATVIRNGIELEKFETVDERDKVREELGVPPAATVVCFVGRLDDQKGVDHLIDALACLDLRRLGLYCWLVGEGPKREELEARSRAQRIQDYLKFLSFRADVPRILSASDFFVLPSRFEAMPIALLEAMAAGLASVVTDVGDNSLLIEHGVHGLVVRPGDVQRLASGIETLAQDQQLRQRMGLAAREASKAYSSEATARQVEAAYRSVLGETRKTPVRHPKTRT